MRARAVRGLVRAAWRTATSYRLATVFSIASLALTVLPIFFVARALQPMMAKAIANEGQQYFGFVLVGTVALSYVGASVGALPAALEGGIASGYLEWLFTTRASVAATFVGLSVYPLLWTTVRAVLTLGAGWLLGATITIARLPLAVVVIALLIVTHWAIGLVGGALLLAFRTMGPLTSGVLVVSALFGGTYWPTTSIPSWLSDLAAVTPMAFGLRALRVALLDGPHPEGVWRDVAILSAFAAALLLVGVISIRAALAYAKRRGTLSLY